MKITYRYTENEIITWLKELETEFKKDFNWRKQISQSLGNDETYYLMKFMNMNVGCCRGFNDNFMIIASDLLGLKLDWYHSKIDAVETGLKIGVDVSMEDAKNILLTSFKSIIAVVEMQRNFKNDLAEVERKYKSMIKEFNDKIGATIDE